MSNRCPAQETGHPVFALPDFGPTICQNTLPLAIHSSRIHPSRRERHDNELRVGEKKVVHSASAVAIAAAGQRTQDII